VRSSENRERRH